TFESQVDDIIYKNQGIIKKEGIGDNMKVLYRTFNYTSNPKLNDTDFDGLNDNIDTRKLDNYIKSTNKVDEGKEVDVTYGSDFRYFFINNSKFNDELAMMSFIVSNLATDNRTINIDQDGSVGYINIDTYMREMGIMPIETIDLYGGKAKCYTGVKEIQYYDIKKYVYCAFVGGFTDIESYVDLLYNDDGSEEEKFKEIADIIYDKLQNYTKNGEYCYWISGMNIAGGVANLLACELKGDECYAYIMDPPNISRKDYGTYNYIMNIVNEDNLIPKVYKDTKNHINGRRFNNSIKEDLMQIYRKYDSAKNYKGDYAKTNKLKEGIQEAKEVLESEEQKDYFEDLTYDLYNKLLTDTTRRTLYNKKGNMIETIDKDGNIHIHEDITENELMVYAMDLTDRERQEVLFHMMYGIRDESEKEAAKTAREDKTKIAMAKGLDGFSETSSKKHDTLPETTTTEKTTKENKTMKEALDKVTDWYLNHVYTYRMKNVYDSYSEFSTEEKLLGKHGYTAYMIDGNIEYYNYSEAKVIDKDKEEFVMVGGNFEKVSEKTSNSYEVVTGKGANKKTTYFVRSTEALPFDKNYICTIKAHPNALKKADNNNHVHRESGNIYKYYDDEKLLQGFEYNEPGDDCARFAFAVLQLSTQRDVADYGINTGDDARQFNDDDIKKIIKSGVMMTAEMSFMYMRAKILLKSTTRD
ncbi:MAG: hypothetical protein MJ151_02060, partial [Lachnospiraceae bacterium]|nr:hypothetical protein [Lachnospiraceae bacterium]